MDSVLPFPIHHFCMIQGFVKRSFWKSNLRHTFCEGAFACWPQDIRSSASANQDTHRPCAAKRTLPHLLKSDNGVLLCRCDLFIRLFPVRQHRLITQIRNTKWAVWRFGAPYETDEGLDINSYQIIHISLCWFGIVNSPTLAWLSRYWNVSHLSLALTYGQ